MGPNLVNYHVRFVLSAKFHKNRAHYNFEQTCPSYFGLRSTSSTFLHSPILLMIPVQNFMLIKNHTETYVSKLTEMKLLTFKALETMKIHHKETLNTTIRLPCWIYFKCQGCFYALFVQCRPGSYMLSIKKHSSIL